MSKGFTEQSKPLISLQRKMLSWDYFQLLQDAAKGKERRQLVAVPTTFTSIDQYLDIFSPLVLEECTAQILQGDEESGRGAAPVHLVVASVAEPDEEKFLHVRLSFHDEKQPLDYAENDLIVMSKENLFQSRNMENKPSIHALGVVESHEGSLSLRVKFYLDESSQTGNIEGTARVRVASAALTAPDTGWYILKLCNTSTITREWVALQNVRSIPFLDTLLHGGKEGEAVRSKPLVVPGPMREVMSQMYNAAQMDAVTSGLDGNPLVLIQGPPGTGKTKTILGLLSIIMHSAPAGAVDRGGSSLVTPLPEEEGKAGGGGKRGKSAGKKGGTGREEEQGGSGSGGGSQAPPRDQRQDEQEDAGLQRRLWLRQSPWLLGKNTRDDPTPRETLLLDAMRAHAKETDPTSSDASFSTDLFAHVSMNLADGRRMRLNVDRLESEAEERKREEMEDEAARRPRVTLPGAPHGPGHDGALLARRLEDAHRAAAALQASLGRPLVGADRQWEDIFGLGVKCTPRVISEDYGPKAHVLVCAPSNSALDEIVLRILTTGLYDARGRIFTPSVVRVGVNIHHSVQSVSLQTLIETRIQQMEAAGKILGRQDKDKIRLAILEEAAIVCSTLGFSGSGIFSKMSRKFDVVVIDEAAQAVEPSVLVPLCQGARQVYLVGDPNQLPATVISTRATDFNYNRSLFRRLQSAGHPVHRLTMQYRMHPAIRTFPSQAFYQNSLEDGPHVAADSQRPWHAVAACFGPLALLDVRGREENPVGSASVVNQREAQLVVALYLSLVEAYPVLLRDASAVGIISPYKAQVKLIRTMLDDALGESRKRVDVNTIDGFQGREKDVVLFSTVRSREKKSIGFVADERRINVGLTRARSSMIVVGHVGALAQDTHWEKLVEHCQQERCMYRVPAGQGGMRGMAGVTFFRQQIKKMVSGELKPVEPMSVSEYAVKDTVEEQAVAAEPDASLVLDLTDVRTAAEVEENMAPLKGDQEGKGKGKGAKIKQEEGGGGGGGGGGEGKRSEAPPASKRTRKA